MKQSIWSHVHVLYQWRLLLEFSSRFLEDDVDDPTLNHALLDAFFGDLPLYIAFKKLFVCARASSPKTSPTKFDGLPAWALQSKEFHELLPIVLPDLIPSDGNVVFENELR